jgi:hypothetical protein
MSDPQNHSKQEPDRPLIKRLHARPMLVIPIAVALAIGFAWLRPAAFHRVQDWLEAPAPYLLAAATGIYALRAGRTRNPLHLLMAVLAATLTLREIHFGWMDWAVYVGVGAVALWAVLWRRRLTEPLQNVRHSSWLLATLVAYAVAVMISQRYFRFIPGEEAIHRSLEEWMETAAHLMLIATALAGDWRRYARWCAPLADDGAAAPAQQPVRMNESE